VTVTLCWQHWWGITEEFAVGSSEAYQSWLRLVPSSRSHTSYKESQW